MLNWIKALFAAEDPPLFSPAEIEYYLIAVYNDLINQHNLSLEYHYKVGGHLESAVLKGFDVSSINDLQFTTDSYQTLQSLRRNIYMFSAAKQYTQVREMSAVINKGMVHSFSEFKEIANTIFEQYNKNYLRTEFKTALLQAEMASQWVEIEAGKEDLPMIRYHTQKDSRVRPEHAILDGITKHVDDPFWNTFFPPCGWSCRCFVTRHSEHTRESGKVPDVEWGTPEFPSVFKMNPGKDKLVFNGRHPYFTVARGDADFKSNNYNLPRM